MDTPNDVSKECENNEWGGEMQKEIHVQIRKNG